MRTTVVTIKLLLLKVVMGNNVGGFIGGSHIIDIGKLTRVRIPTSGMI